MRGALATLTKGVVHMYIYETRYCLAPARCYSEVESIASNMLNPEKR